MTSPPSTGEPLKRFGWFSGVFTPSILTILGVIMFLRMGWVVGNAGLLGAIAIVVISHVITIATGLSVSSIATNRVVGAGGAYNIISRSLGAPVGAAIGIPLFLGQALSVTFYIVGFSESVAYLWPDIDQRSLSLIVLLILTAISMKSAELAIKTQYVVMVMIGAALVSFFAGLWVPGADAPPKPESVRWLGGGDAGFGAVFAVFFPAVTGIMAGVGMSGDLRDPRKDLPRGTMTAIFVGMAVYLVIPVVLALQADPLTLQGDTDVFWDVSRWPFLIFLGVWGATISSAVGSILTAPRTLQALAWDGLAPRFAGRGYGPANEPRIGTAITFTIALLGILLGNLDAIAPVLTMFFLATYGFTNLACGLERWAASPSFRPDFVVPAGVGLFGALACFYVMSIISLPAMLLAMVCCAGIFIVTQRRSLESDYGDARFGIWSALARASLLNLQRAEFHPRNWRPNLIIFGGDALRRRYLLEFGSSLVQNRGVVTYFQIIEGDVAELTEERKALTSAAQERHAEFTNAFFRVDIAASFYEGALAAAQSYGVGRYEANTVMLGWSGRPERSQQYTRLLADLVALDRSLLVLRYDPDRGWGERKEIHVWWGGLAGNGGLMLLVAWLLNGERHWRDARVQVLTVVDDIEQRRTAEDQIVQVLAAARLNARPRVLMRGDREISEIMTTESGDADLAIVGFSLPDPERAEEFVNRTNALLDGLPSTVLVHSARGFDGEPVLFEE